MWKWMNGYISEMTANSTYGTILRNHQNHEVFGLEKESTYWPKEADA